MRLYLFCVIFVKGHWGTDEKRHDMGCGNGHCLCSPVGNFIRSALMLILVDFYILLFLHLVFSFDCKKYL